MEKKSRKSRLWSDTPVPEAAGDDAPAVEAPVEAPPEPSTAKASEAPKAEAPKAPTDSSTVGVQHRRRRRPDRW